MKVSTRNDICDISLPEVRSNQEAPRRSVWLDSWLFEWITLVFSIACFIAISIILWIYDGKERPELVHGLSLNTIISALATGCKSSLVLVIGEAISQLKWLWYQDPNQRQLVGMQRFDAASRGPLGSLMIIVHHRARSLVSLGAAIIVLLLAFDPFMQQILSYSIRSTIDTDSTARALAPQLRHFFAQAGTLHPGSQSEMEKTFTQGFFSFSADGFKVPPQCSSGNCTWSEFPSIGICSHCADMTSTASVNCDLPPPTEKFNRTCNVSLSVGSSYTFNVTSEPQGFGGYPELIFPTQIIWQPLDMNHLFFSLFRADGAVQVFNLPNETVAGVKNPLTTLAYVELAVHGGNASVSDSIYFRNATACSLSTCQREYSIHVENGSPSIHTQNIDSGTIYLKYPGKAVLKNSPWSLDDNPLCWMPGPPDPSGYNATRDFAFCETAMYELDQVRNYFPPSGDARLIAGPEFTGWEVDGHPDTSVGADVRMKQLERIGFENSMGNIAAAFTKLGLETTEDTFNGTVHVSKVFVSVRWPWMIFPGLLILVGSIFLVATVALSKNVPLWKSSALVPYYHGTEGIEDNNNNVSLTTSAMEKRAEEQVFRFEHSENDGKLVLRLQGEIDISEDPEPEPPERLCPESVDKHNIVNKI
ncbi:hypothetical protein PENSTE_c009G08821 [Penicillium steckii]|uniref:Uncharacterized protein n=1 Tax=Penicillium steckii TaxID=303698 RepID=A0A1V6TBB3_9EURO|nr:hypothetical protein PENSTE_c009G08821 [Penicillium steckii]